MTDEIWMGISPGRQSTRVLAIRGKDEVMLKADMLLSPASPRAMQLLLEAVALWEGVTIRAVLVVDDHPPLSDSSLYRDTFADHGSTPLYTLHWLPRGYRRRRRRDVLHGVGDFHDLERLLRTEVAR
jgi:hypothetical protein